MEGKAVALYVVIEAQHENRSQQCFMSVVTVPECEDLVQRSYAKVAL